MPDFFQVPVTKVYHSDLYQTVGGHDTRIKTGYVAVKNQLRVNSLETAQEFVSRCITAQTLFTNSHHIVWEDENWTGKNGWKLVENSLTVV